jgi:uncharacterized small protein (DUF1192 family)
VFTLETKWRHLSYNLDNSVLQSLPLPEGGKNVHNNVCRKQPKPEGDAMDDELDRLKPVGLGPEMERWNRVDLEAYIARMHAEIARVETILSEKDSVSAAAAALFGGGAE